MPYFYQIGSAGKSYALQVDPGMEIMNNVILVAFGQVFRIGMIRVAAR